MKRCLLVAVVGLLLCSCHHKKTELVLLGTVHQPIQNFNADSLYNILLKIQPDVILFEVDSSFFTETFEFNKTWESNENIATIRYMNDFDVDVRPYEFTGRNEYRIKIGSRPTDSKATKLLDSLYHQGSLKPSHEKIYQSYLQINDSLNAFAYLGAEAFNDTNTDSIAQKRQLYQYKKLLAIMGGYPVFSATYHIKNDGDSISYYEGYQRAAAFWDLRNQTMAKHILHFISAYHGKRIVVLNGYFHRYYLSALIRPREEELDFTVREFYEY